MRADRALRRACRPDLALLRERQLRDVCEPACSESGAESRLCQLLAIERRALEEVLELRAVGGIVDGHLLGPRTGFDLGREHQGHPSFGSRSYWIASSALPAMSKPTGLLLLGQMREQAGGTSQKRNRLHGGRREAQIEQHRRGGHGDIHRQRLAPRLCDRIAEVTRKQDVGPADPAGVCELEDAFSTGVERPVDRMPKAGRLVAGSVDLTRQLVGDGRRVATGEHLLLSLLEQSRARLRRAENDGAGAEDPRRQRALQRSGIGGQRHARCDVGRHHPVLGDRDEEQIEEVALVFGRLAAGEQQVEVLGEGQPAHQVAGEVLPPHLDPVGIRLADAADWGLGHGTAEDRPGSGAAHRSTAPLRSNPASARSRRQRMSSASRQARWR